MSLTFLLFFGLLSLVTSKDDSQDSRRKSFIFMQAQNQRGRGSFFRPIKKAEGPKPVSDTNMQLIMLTKKVFALERRIEELTNAAKETSKGVTVLRGPPGRDGMPGRDGQAGHPGRDGQPGRDGRDAVGCGKHPVVDSGSVFSRVRRGKFEGGRLLESDKPNNVTYIRWGHTSCPTSQGISTLLSGRVTITYSLPDPKYKCSPAGELKQDKAKLTPLGFASLQVYGVEYHLKEYNPFQKPTLDGKDVACTVCNIVNRQSVVVFPNYLSCPENWRLEYKGFLMSENWNHIRTENICVDIDAQISGNKPYDEHTATISPVEAYCNGEPCGSDTDEKATRCVVCSSGENGLTP